MRCNRHNPLGATDRAQSVSMVPEGRGDHVNSDNRCLEIETEKLFNCFEVLCWGEKQNQQQWSSCHGLSKARGVLNGLRKQLRIGGKEKRFLRLVVMRLERDAQVWLCVPLSTFNCMKMRKKIKAVFPTVWILPKIGRLERQRNRRNKH